MIAFDNIQSMLLVLQIKLVNYHTDLAATIIHNSSEHNAKKVYTKRKVITKWTILKNITSFLFTIFIQNIQSEDINISLFPSCKSATDILLVLAMDVLENITYQSNLY